MKTWKLPSFVKPELMVVALAAGLLATGCVTPPRAPLPTSKAQQSAVTPAQALEKLEAGNALAAGNILDDEILGSLEFAFKMAGEKLIAVVGHSHCGEVKGACSGAQLGHLTGFLDKIQPSVAEAKAKIPVVAATDGKFIEAVAELNVHHILQQIREQSRVLRELIDSGQVGLVGGL